MVLDRGAADRAYGGSKLKLQEYKIKIKDAEIYVQLVEESSEPSGAAISADNRLERSLCD
jgi:hypothetical protein